MSAGKATTDAMDFLHGLMAESMTDELRRGLARAKLPPRICQDGEMAPNPDYEPLSPKLLGVIRAFLKDNGIDAPVSSPRLNTLADKLRNMNPDDIARETAEFGRA